MYVASKIMEQIREQAKNQSSRPLDPDIIETREGVFRRVPVKPHHQSFVVGVDLGCSQDYTAVCVLEHSITPLETWTKRERRHGRVGGPELLKQDAQVVFGVRALERFELGTPYPAQVRRVEEIMSKPQLRGAPLILDGTGVGAAVCDLFEQGPLLPIRVVITGGYEAVLHTPTRWAVPKTDIIGALDARIGTGELQFSPGLALAEALREELKNFNRNRSEASGRESYGARVGKHDDLVLAVGLACWWATKASGGSVGSNFVRGLLP